MERLCLCQALISSKTVHRSVLCICGVCTSFTSNGIVFLGRSNRETPNPFDKRKVPHNPLNRSASSSCSSSLWSCRSVVMQEPHSSFVLQPVIRVFVVCSFNKRIVINIDWSYNASKACQGSKINQRLQTWL